MSITNNRGADRPTPEELLARKRREAEFQTKIAFLRKKWAYLLGPIQPQKEQQEWH